MSCLARTCTLASSCLLKLDWKHFLYPVHISLRLPRTNSCPAARSPQTLQPVSVNTPPGQTYTSTERCRPSRVPQTQASGGTSTRSLRALNGNGRAGHHMLITTMSELRMLSSKTLWTSHISCTSLGAPSLGPVLHCPALFPLEFPSFALSVTSCTTSRGSWEHGPSLR